MPVYEILRIPDDQENVLLVMPLLREFDDPRFDTFGEAVECFRQIFEVCEALDTVSIQLGPDFLSRAYNSCIRTTLLIGTADVAE